MRRYPRINRAGCPSSVLSCTAWGFSCLANCSASGELLPRLFTLACTLLPKNRRCVFCDTFHRRSFPTATPAHFTRHGAVWCSDFPPVNRKRFTSDHLPSVTNLSQIPKSGSQETRRTAHLAVAPYHLLFPGFVVSRFHLFSCFPNSKRCRDSEEENCDHCEREKQFSNHGTETSQQAAPTCPPGINHSFPGNEFTKNRADHWTYKQPDDAKK